MSSSTPAITLVAAFSATMSTAAPFQPLPSSRPPAIPPIATLAFVPAVVNAYQRSSSAPSAMSATKAGQEAQYSRSAHSTRNMPPTSVGSESTSR